MNTDELISLAKKVGVDSHEFTRRVYETAADRTEDDGLSPQEWDAAIVRHAQELTYEVEMTLIQEAVR